jgi:hypothetical protein
MLERRMRMLERRMRMPDLLEPSELHAHARHARG